MVNVALWYIIPVSSFHELCYHTTWPGYAPGPAFERDISFDGAGTGLHMLVYLLSLLDDVSDKAIFNEMFGRYEHRTLAIAMSILKNTYDAEDAVMAAWVKVALHFSTAKKHLSKSWSAFEGWLTVIVKNAAKDELRKRNRAPKPVEIWEIPSYVDIEAKSELHIILELIRSMPEQTRALLEMRIVGEYSFKEIGKSLGCSAGTAQRRYSRAMEVLRKQMGVRPE